jgi:hypothetical protein
MRLRRTGLRWRRVGEEVVVLDVDGSEYFSLNPSGALLWERVADADFSDEQLVAQLQSEYGIGAEQARADVAEFVGALDKHDLLER